MHRLYHPFWFQLEGRQYYLLWFTGEVDGFVKSQDGSILWFSDLESLLGFAQENNYKIESDDLTLLNLDQLLSWLEKPTAKEVHCDLFLNAWNLFTDVSKTVGEEFEENRTQNTSIYDKLFWGNNLPSVTPPGKRYTPKWTTKEVQALRKILTSGLSLFLRSVSLNKPVSGLLQ